MFRVKILFVTQWFPPEPGTFVAADITRGLAALGHEVHVLTGIPNYPTGKVLPGYRIRPYQRETFERSVVVHRAPLFPSHDQSMLRRGLNYLSFAAAASAIVAARVPRCDVTLVYSSPATAALPAVVKRAAGTPYMLLIQDLWPDSVLEASFVSGRCGRMLSRVLDKACDAAYQTSSAIGVISPGMVDTLINRGVPRAKLHYTPNWISDAHLYPDSSASAEARLELGLPAGRTFLYAGNFGDLQNLPTLVRAFAMVPEAQLALVGDGVVREDLESLVADLGAKNVVIYPAQPASSIGAWLAACDVQIVSLRDTPLLRVTMPSKMQTALASARPVLAATAGDPAALVDRQGAGLSASPADPTGIAHVVRRFMEMRDDELLEMGRRARATYEEHFSVVAGPARLQSVLASMCQGKP